MRRLGSCCGLHRLNQQGGSLKWVVAALPRFPEDPLFALLPLPWDGVEVLSIEIGVAAGAKPPATYRVRAQKMRSESCASILREDTAGKKRNFGF